MKIDLNLKQFTAIIGSEVQAQKNLSALNIALIKANCNSALRQAAFIAQCAHETACFKFLIEIWGPTEQQKKYDPPSDLAKRLGNAEKGDGFKYRGRGWLQTTGKYNYAKLAKALNLPLVERPDLVNTPEIAGLAAANYWLEHDLNTLADEGWAKFEILTKKINGGLNGLFERKKYFAKALQVLVLNG